MEICRIWRPEALSWQPAACNGFHVAVSWMVDNPQTQSRPNHNPNPFQPPICPCLSLTTSATQSFNPEICKLSRSIFSSCTPLSSWWEVPAGQGTPEGKFIFCFSKFIFCFPPLSLPLKWQTWVSIVCLLNHAHTSVNSLFFNFSTLKTLREMFSWQMLIWSLLPIRFWTFTSDFQVVLLCSDYILHTTFWKTIFSKNMLLWQFV